MSETAVSVVVQGVTVEEGLEPKMQQQSTAAERCFQTTLVMICADHRLLRERRFIPNIHVCYANSNALAMQQIGALARPE